MHLFSISILVLLTDKYANYVMQKALECADHSESMFTHPPSLPTSSQFVCKHTHSGLPSPPSLPPSLPLSLPLPRVCPRPEQVVDIPDTSLPSSTAQVHLRQAHGHQCGKDTPTRRHAQFSGSSLAIYIDHSISSRTSAAMPQYLSYQEHIAIGKYHYCTFTEHD